MTTTSRGGQRTLLVAGTLVAVAAANAMAAPTSTPAPAAAADTTISVSPTQRALSARSRIDLRGRAAGDRRQVELRLGDRMLYRATTSSGEFAGASVRPGTAARARGRYDLVALAGAGEGRRVSAERRVRVAGGARAAARPDRARPRHLRFTHPQAAASGRMRLRVSAPPDNRIERVLLKVDRRTVQVVTVRPGSFSRTGLVLDTRDLSDGTHLLRAVARTASGEVVVSRRKITVRNDRRTGPRPDPEVELMLPEEPRPTPAPSAQPAPGAGAGAPTAPAPGRVLWTGDYESGDVSQYRTDNGHSGVHQTDPDRIRVVTAPVAQGRYAARFEVREGDKYGSSSGHRNEIVYWSEDSEGDERTYTWSTMFDPTYPHDAANGWQIFTQWHVNNPTGPPPLYFFASGDRIGMKAVRLAADSTSDESVVHWTTDMARGQWHHFRLHVRWSTDPSKGWMELWHNGNRVVDRTPLAGLQPGGFANYIKQGLYRSDRIRGTGVVYHDGMTITQVAG